MTLVTGKKKSFSLFLSQSGNGKTLTMFLLMKAAARPTIIVDSYGQFKGPHKTLRQLMDYFGDPENTLDFLECRRHILVTLKPDEAAAFYGWVMTMGRKLSGALIVNDEIDLTLGTARVTEKHPYYEFCNRGRHFEFDHMATARATQNIPKCLTQQTDYFYVGRAQNDYMKEYIAQNVGVKGLKELAEGLPRYTYLKIDTERESVARFKLDPALLDLFA